VLVVSRCDHCQEAGKIHPLIENDSAYLLGVAFSYGKKAPHGCAKLLLDAFCISRLKSFLPKSGERLVQVSRVSQKKKESRTKVFFFLNGNENIIFFCSKDFT